MEDAPDGLRLVIEEAFTLAAATCPKCRDADAVVYFDGEYERLICDRCLYEEWDQPRGTYPALHRLEGCT